MSRKQREFTIEKDKSKSAGSSNSLLFIDQPSSFILPRHRHWRDKFREAFRGMKLGIRGHSSFFVHFFFAAVVAMAAIVLRCEPLEWCLLLGCIGLVLTAELFNSAVETIYWGLDEVSQPRVRNCLDIAAGAVLLASITAAIIGCLVFLPKVAALLVHLVS
jgi:diacylglycerol kinase